MIERAKEIDTLRKLLKANPVFGILGGRQVGKAILAKLLQKESKGGSRY